MARPKLTYAIGNAASTTLASGMTTADTTAALTSSTAFDDATVAGEGMILIDEGTATEELAYSTGVSGGSVTVPLANRGLEGGSPQAHSSGASVKGVLTVGMWNDLVDSLVNFLSKTTGAVDTTKIVTLTGTQTLTNKTLTSPNIGTQIGDTSGNELIKLTATASAVNEFTLANAATGNSPAFQMSGGDSNVGFDLRMKGTGKFRRPTIVELPWNSTGTNFTTGDGKAMFRVPAELNGMNLTGVAMSMDVAGTTGTMDVQLHRRRAASNVDMLSTKLTIDSTEEDTSTAATAAVINTSNDDVATNDKIYLDVDAVHTTPGTGVGVVEMRFELP